MLSELDVNKSPGPDGIHPRFINELTEQLCLPLSIIFKESMKTSIIPKQWKLARVSAIHKKGSKKMASNYRPVSITSIVCRTMEKILRDNMASFLVENNLLANYQFGFINSLSATGDIGRQPPLLPPQLAAIRVDTITHNYRLSRSP